MRLINFQENSITCILLILTSICCIGALYSFNNPQHIIHNNHFNKLFIKNLLRTNTMDLEKLKTFLTGSLIDNLHMKEFYNGMPIVNMPKKHLSIDDVRDGWFHLYNSKLFNGVVTLKQNRITEENSVWKTDTGSYENGWIRAAGTNDNITPWVYRSTPIMEKYFDFWLPYADNSGFVLHLTGGRSNYKMNLTAHLQNGWLDNRTRSLIVEFQTYTPNTDCITLFEILFQTTSGLMFTLNSSVRTVPASSLFVTWTTYVFTLVFACAYGLSAARLIGWGARAASWYGGRRAGDGNADFWTAYEWTLLAVVACTTLAASVRWRVMELAARQYATPSADSGGAPLADTLFRTHCRLVALAAVAVAMALFQPHDQLLRVARADRAAAGAVRGPAAAAVAAYALTVAFGAWWTWWLGDGRLDGACAAAVGAAYFFTYAEKNAGRRR